MLGRSIARQALTSDPDGVLMTRQIGDMPAPS
jgi:hypothetical protein